MRGFIVCRLGGCGAEGRDMGWVLEGVWLNMRDYEIAVMWWSRGMSWEGLWQNTGGYEVGVLEVPEQGASAECGRGFTEYWQVWGGSLVWSWVTRCRINGYWLGLGGTWQNMGWAWVVVLLDGCIGQSITMGGNNKWYKGRCYFGSDAGIWLWSGDMALSMAATWTGSRSDIIESRQRSPMSGIRWWWVWWGNTVYWMIRCTELWKTVAYIAAGIALVTVN